MLLERRSVRARKRLRGRARCGHWQLARTGGHVFHADPIVAPSSEGGGSLRSRVALDTARIPCPEGSQRLARWPLTLRRPAATYTTSGDMTGMVAERSPPNDVCPVTSRIVDGGV